MRVLRLVRTGCAHGQFDAPYAHGDDRADLQQLEPDRVRTRFGERRVLQADAPQRVHA